ncbi:MAG: hypothetical protein JW966_11570 [Anaerolineae bacterium]|nr:hypothetical protein [Anaerolineae bacterium]
MLHQWEYLTTYLSGLLDFPDSVDEAEALAWASKSITQQLNEYARLGWEVIDIRWITNMELMITFKRAVQADAADDAGPF